VEALRGQVKERWGKFDQFVGLLQEKYGYIRERAEEEIDRWTAEHKAHQHEVAVPAK